jgi:hypothetical protein
MGTSGWSLLLCCAVAVAGLAPAPDQGAAGPAASSTVPANTTVRAVAATIRCSAGLVALTFDDGPAAETTPAFLTERAIGTEECLLSEVFSICGVTGKPVGHVVDLLLAPFHQVLKARLGAGYRIHQFHLSFCVVAKVLVGGMIAPGHNYYMPSTSDLIPAKPKRFRIWATS